MRIANGSVFIDEGDWQYVVLEKTLPVEIYQFLRDYTFKMLSMFGTTCICDRAFSNMKQIQRNASFYWWNIEKSTTSYCLFKNWRWFGCVSILNSRVKSVKDHVFLNHIFPFITSIKYFNILPTSKNSEYINIYVTRRTANIDDLYTLLITILFMKIFMRYMLWAASKKFQVVKIGFLKSRAWTNQFAWALLGDSRCIAFAYHKRRLNP